MAGNYFPFLVSALLIVSEVSVIKAASFVKEENTGSNEAVTPFDSSSVRGSPEQQNGTTENNGLPTNEDSIAAPKDMREGQKTLVDKLHDSITGALSRLQRMSPGDRQFITYLEWVISTFPALSKVPVDLPGQCARTALLEHICRSAKVLGKHLMSFEADLIARGRLKPDYVNARKFAEILSADKPPTEEEIKAKQALKSSIKPLASRPDRFRAPHKSSQGFPTLCSGDRKNDGNDDETKPGIDRKEAYSIKEAMEEFDRPRYISKEASGEKDAEWRPFNIGSRNLELSKRS